MVCNVLANYLLYLYVLTTTLVSQLMQFPSSLHLSMHLPVCIFSYLLNQLTFDFDLLHVMTMACRGLKVSVLGQGQGYGLS